MQSCHSLITHAMRNCTLHIQYLPMPLSIMPILKGCFMEFFNSLTGDLKKFKRQEGCVGCIHVLYVSTLYDASKD